jgi:ADP-heptose:LPS heptosyltransferase
MRFLLGIKTFSVFDRTSSNYAGNRYKDTINVLGICKVEFKALQQLGIQNSEFRIQNYVVINPAGAFENRNWAIDNYVAFCELWLKEVDKDAKFVILGITKIKEKAVYLKQKLGDVLIDLVDKTTPIEAMQIVSKAKIVVSEDGGLLHISYATGTPTIGILGSTRNDWTNPILPHTYFFNSSDMPCGNCMLETCKFDEVKCLTRITPEAVLQGSLKLLEKR